MLMSIVLGISTVDDLLERIDDSVENAKIVVNDGKQNAQKANPQSKDDEPIRIVYEEIHCIEDLLAKVNDQPGSRKIVLEGAPDESKTVSLEKSTEDGTQEKTTVSKTSKTSAPAPQAPNASKEEDSTPDDPNADQIHVNIDNIRSVDDLLDRIDSAVQKVPVVIDNKPQAKKAAGQWSVSL